MIQVYVTEKPDEAQACPFYMDNNKKCNICNDKCCLNKGEECQHLITLNFGFIDELEEADNGT